MTIGDKTDQRILAMVDQKLRFTEIAERLGISKGSVAGRVFRLRHSGVDVQPASVESLVDIPAWVPDHLRRMYRQLALDFDEFEAAKECRALKREGIAP